MLALGIDPGTATTGYGLVREDRESLALVDFGVITTPAGQPLAERLQSIYQGLANLVREHQRQEGGPVALGSVPFREHRAPEGDLWPGVLVVEPALAERIDLGVVAALEDSEHADNTLIVLWSDHGWHLGEQQVWGKHTLFENALQSPLIIRVPERYGIAPGVVSSSRVLPKPRLPPAVSVVCGHVPAVPPASRSVRTRSS